MKVTTRVIANGKYTYKLAWDRARKLKAIPLFSRLPKNRKQILAVYVKAQIKNFNSRVKYEVDHIVPLQSTYICGLHCVENLQIITHNKNQLKSNVFIPYREVLGKRYYFNIGQQSKKSPKIPKKYNRTKKCPLKIAKKRSKTSGIRSKIARKKYLKIT